MMTLREAALLGVEIEAARLRAKIEAQPGETPATAAQTPARVEINPHTKRPYRFSAETRERMRLAQRARHADFKKLLSMSARS